MNAFVLVSSLLVISTDFVVKGQSCEGKCVKINSCPPLVNKLDEAQKSSDKDRRSQLIKEVQTQICDKKERTVCCPSEDILEESQESIDLPKIGEFINIFHDIGGTVYKKDDHTVLIKGFTYDGEGPDAFFLAGTSGAPSNPGDAVLPYPYEGEHYQYDDRRIPILKGAKGDKDIELTLPSDMTVEDLKWISVWCRDYTVDFGHASISI